MFVNKNFQLSFLTSLKAQARHILEYGGTWSVKEWGSH